MLARDIMTTAVVSVGADTSVRAVAQLLAAKSISAVPVVDDGGAPIGMVSEGDLIGRADVQRDARADWWLAMLANGDGSPSGAPASRQAADATAASIMSAPVITVDETTDIAEVARLLENYRIKRVPVLRGGKIVGIVSRADLIRVLASSPPAAAAEAAETAARGLRAVIAGLDERFHALAAKPSEASVTAPATPSNTAITAQGFRALAAKYRHREDEKREQSQRAAADHLEDEIKDLTAHHVGDDDWRTALGRAVEAAEHGDKEYLLLRFPSALCSDGGRAVNAPSPDWPHTLRGEAAEIYLRWEHELRPRGFHLTARVLEFPGGFPGDIGLFLSWGS